MNSDTGEIYIGDAAILAAKERGEPIEPIGPRIAELDKRKQEIRERFPLKQTESAREHRARLLQRERQRRQ